MLANWELFFLAVAAGFALGILYAECVIGRSPNRRRGDP
jgi:hypothetical protein